MARPSLRSSLALLRDRGFVVFVIGLVTVLYALGLLVPQRRMVPLATWEAWRAQSPLLVAFLERSGLSDVYAAPGTYVALGFFFLSLAAVVVDRFPRLVRRSRLDHGLPLDAAALARRSRTVALPQADPAAAVDRAAEHLRAAGYAIHAEGGAIRAVRFRRAPLGFVLFHGAFALLLAGGVLLDLTRFSGQADVGEGETFDARAGPWVDRPRVPRIGASRPEVSFTVVSVEPRSEAGFPLALRVGFVVPGDPVPRVANINEPAPAGGALVLVRSAGAAPLFTCEAEGAADGLWVKLVPDAEGRTRFLLEPCALDVLARPFTPGAEPVPGPGEGKGVMLASAGVARLEDVATTGVEVAVRGPDGAIARGVLRPGDAIATPDGRRVLRMPELRFYARVQVIDEHGGALLWAGFVLGVVGLVLRLVLFRRELVVAADPGGGRVLVASAADAAGWRPEALVEGLAAALGAPPARAAGGTDP